MLSNLGSLWLNSASLNIYKSFHETNMQGSPNAEGVSRAVRGRPGHPGLEQQTDLARAELRGPEPRVPRDEDVCGGRDPDRGQAHPHHRGPGGDQHRGGHRPGQDWGRPSHREEEGMSSWRMARPEEEKAGPGLHSGENQDSTWEAESGGKVWMWNLSQNILKDF